jgi:hypothetical protein
MIGFPLAGKTRYNSSLRNAIGRARFRAYILQTYIGDVVLSHPLPKGNAVAPGPFYRPRPEST